MPHLSKPKYSLIPRKDLKPSTWYLGDGRSGLVPALWTGEFFASVGYSWGQYEIDQYKYGAQGFSPYQEIIDAKSTQ